jgi:hypothetical protein
MSQEVEETQPDPKAAKNKVPPKVEPKAAPAKPDPKAKPGDKNAKNPPPLLEAPPEEKDDINAT